MPLPQKIKDAINANSTNTDKASYSKKTNVQAYADTATRDKTEDIYYKFKEAKKTKGISNGEYALIKRYFSNNEIKAQNAVIQKSKADLDKIVRTQKEKENPPKSAPPKTPTVPPITPTVPKPTTDRPEIVKPSQRDSNRITDTDTGEYKAKAVPTASDYAKEIAWREKQDEKVYEDRKTGMSTASSNKVGGFSGGGSSSWGDINKGTQSDSFNKLLNGEKQFDIEEGTIIGLLEKPKTREQLQTKYNSVASQNDSGTYYEDISFTGGQGLIGERGVTYVVNLDEGWAAQYKHRGVGIGASVLPLDVQYTKGKVIGGDISDPEHYTKLFYQQTGGPVVGKDDAWGLFSDTKIKQTGTSLMSNVGIGGTLSYYDLVTVEYFNRNDN